MNNPLLPNIEGLHFFVSLLLDLFKIILGSGNDPILELRLFRQFGDFRRLGLQFGLNNLHHFPKLFDLRE